MKHPEVLLVHVVVDARRGTVLLERDADRWGLPTFPLPSTLTWEEACDADCRARGLVRRSTEFVTLFTGEGRAPEPAARGSAYFLFCSRVEGEGADAKGVGAKWIGAAEAAECVSEAERAGLRASLAKMGPLNA